MQEACCDVTFCLSADLPDSGQTLTVPQEKIGFARVKNLVEFQETQLTSPRRSRPEWRGK